MRAPGDTPGPRLPDEQLNAMAKTSIHIDPVKDGAVEHNKRQKELDYVRKELTHLNEVWDAPGFTSIQAAKEEARRLYEDAHLKKQHSKATPIREGVVVIDEKTTMADLQRLAKLIEAQWGVKCLQIAIHRDEGHANSSTWKPNLHAHMVFRWTNGQGENPRLSKGEMSHLQDMVADTLHMERGRQSSKKHLDAVAYKIQAQEGRLAQLERQTSAKERLLGIVGKSQADKENEALRAENAALRAKIKQQGDQVSTLQSQLHDSQLKLKAEQSTRAKLERDNRKLLELHERDHPTLKVRTEYKYAQKEDEQHPSRGRKL